jgi:hypothetical protein
MRKHIAHRAHREEPTHCTNFKSWPHLADANLGRSPGFTVAELLTTKSAENA